MKKNIGFRGVALAFFLSFGLISCDKEPKNLWNVEMKTTEKVEIIDVSGQFFDKNVSLNKFKADFPMFQGNISDEMYEQRRKDEKEIKVYQEAINKIDQKKLQTELSEMFSRVKHYFPKFETPKIYLYSSYLEPESLVEPVFFRSDMGMIFVDISAFMGDKNEHYKGLDEYHKKSMNAENLVPKISEVVAETFLVYNPEENKFIDMMISSGKIRILQDTFLPKTADYLKMKYSQDQQNWVVANEVNIWNYFVENDLLFSDDPKLYERFFSVAPFSKFYTEIDQKSSPRVGEFIGWQISKAYFQEKPETKLSDFLIMNATEIFNQSNYKPAE